MKKAIALLALSTAFISGAFAQTSSDGFSVGGVGELGGTAVNPVTENGWSSLNDYRAARDCCGYTNTGSDAQLWTDATNADANSPAQIANANCAAANYQALRSACTGAGGVCQSFQRDTFLPMRDFNQQNPCLSPNYASYADYQAAVSRGFGLNQLDVNLLAEAETNAWNTYCPGSDCSTANRGQFLDAKSGKNLFLSALGDAATASKDGTLSWAQLTAQYGTYQVSVSEPFNTAPEQEWLMAYINSQDNNDSNPMGSATQPSDWKSKVDAVIANDAAVALWVIQEIQAGNMATSYLTAGLLTTAGVSSGYTGDTTVTTAKSVIVDPSKTTSTNVANVANIEAWISGLITPTWDASPNTVIAKNVSSAVNGTQIVTSAATVSSGSITYSLTGDDSSSFAISTSGVVSTSLDLAAGSYDFTVVATPAVGTALSKAFSVSVNTPPTLAAVSCGSGFASSAYSCSSPSGSDADGDSLSYSLVSGPSWLSINAGTGVLSGSPATAGTVSNIIVAVTDGSDTTNSSAFSIIINANPGTALASTSTAATTSQVNDWATFGVNSAVTNDLLNNNTCGAGGDQNCLAAFNAQKASSSCSLAGGGSASAAQLEAYIGCVMVEHHTANVASAALGGGNNISSGCSSTVNLSIPGTCGHPQWSCTLTSAPSSWTLSGANIVIPANYSGSGSQTATVRMSLNIYSPAYTKDVTKTYNVSAAVSGAQNGKKRYSDIGTSFNPTSARSKCIARGGRLATKDEHNSIGGTQEAVFAPNTSNPSVNYSNNCSDSNSYTWCWSNNTCEANNHYGRARRRSNNGSLWCKTSQGSSQVNRTIYYTCADLPSCN